MLRRHRLGTLLLALALLLPLVTSGLQAAERPATKISRMESNLTAGAVIKDKSTVGIVKSFWWYPLPRIVALGLSFDYVGSTLPFVLNVAVNLPLPVVVPFVCAGAGTYLSRGGITHYGGGLKFRIWKKVGLIAEYRRYSHKPNPDFDPPDAPRVRPNYVGAGIAYLF